MTPAAFIEKWSQAKLTERAAAQSHFIDLCRLLGEPSPTEADSKGDWYAFERGARKTSDHRGWADVWKRGAFAWEYKRPGRSLVGAYAQLQQYAPALGNPPLLIVSDTRDIVIHTNWTNSVSLTHLVRLRDLLDPAFRRLLKNALSEPEKLRPEQTRETLTEQTAREFSQLATALRERGHPPEKVAHFISRLVFCMFAQWVGLLKEGLFTRLMETSAERPADFAELACDLFAAMRTGGRVGFDRVRWFNGGLFDDDSALPLLPKEINSVLEVSRKSWADIDPSIFGTLFERGLDPDKRAQLGKFYTDRAKIEMIVDPVIVQPLRAEWNASKTEIQAAIEKARKARSERTKRNAIKSAEATYHTALNRIRSFKVLDPACGSGNFLYVALLALKDIEHEIGIEAEAISPQLLREMPQVGPENLYGIEINAYAADLARVTIWIGEIQWMLKRGWSIPSNPVLRNLNTIECRDALLNADGTIANWPKADVVISNPPFLGNKLMITMLGEKYVGQLRQAYQESLNAGVDLVCFWFAKSWTAIQARSLRRAGLVSTNSIRGG
ncbi:MAG TPA: DNA methyltransferase, partial [Lacipirellulaceae bacterium]|nr:DNA methyltransferase [Lacipirellulaceae bacterium]